MYMFSVFVCRRNYKIYHILTYSTSEWVNNNHQGKPVEQVLNYKYLNFVLNQKLFTHMNKSLTKPQLWLVNAALYSTQSLCVPALQTRTSRPLDQVTLVLVATCFYHFPSLSMCSSFFNHPFWLSPQTKSTWPELLPRCPCLSSCVFPGRKDDTDEHLWPCCEPRRQPIRLQR